LGAFAVIRSKIEGGTAMKTVSVAQAATAPEAVLSARVQKALGELVGAAKEGLLALSVGVGLGVLAELMNEEVEEVVGPKGRHDTDRSAVRHGHEDGSVTLGGRRVPVKRPRVRSADDSEEVPLATYQHFADRDALSGVVLERMLAGVSTRRYARTQEPVGEDIERASRSTSKSAVWRAFVTRTSERLGDLMARRPGDIRLAVLMLDGINHEGPLQRRRLGDHDGGRQGPAWPVGRIDGERGRCDRAAVRSRRSRLGRRAGRALRARWRQGAAKGRP
jgi:mutator family transposase